MGLCQVGAAPASAPARPGPEPGTALICSHSSSRQSAKHWGKIFCLPEQLLINCPFIDAQDKFCLLSLSLSSPSLSRRARAHFDCAHMLLRSLWFSETGTLTPPLNKLQGMPGAQLLLAGAPLQKGRWGWGGIYQVDGKDKKLKERVIISAQSSAALLSSPALAPPHAATTRYCFRFVIAQLVPQPGFHISQMASCCY